MKESSQKRGQKKLSSASTERKVAALSLEAL